LNQSHYFIYRTRTCVLLSSTEWRARLRLSGWYNTEGFLLSFKRLLHIPWSRHFLENL